MPLLTISDLKKLMDGAIEGPQGLPLVNCPDIGFKCSLLKLKQYSCCEVLGYQLASSIGVPVFPAIPIWCPSAFSYEGRAESKGKIGLAIKHVEVLGHVTWEQAASLAPEAVAACLVLSLLNRDELGQFAKTKDGLIFFDLERLFPAFCPECAGDQTWEEVSDSVNLVSEIYRKEIAPCLLNEVPNAVDKLKLTEPFKSALKDATKISIEELIKLFDIRPHPLAAQIGEIAANIAATKFKQASQFLGV